MADTVEREEEDDLSEEYIKPSERRCIVTKQILPKEDMIRFVASPEGILFPDLDNKLPGRGIWLRVGRKYLEEAVKKGLFSKAAKKKVIVPENIVETLEALIKTKCLKLLGLARKAGLAIAGFEKVIASLQKKQSGLLFAAKDGAEEGKGKIKSIAGNIPIIELFNSDEISESLGRVNCVHVSIKSGKMADSILKETQKLKEYRFNSN